LGSSAPALNTTLYYSTQHISTMLRHASSLLLVLYLQSCFGTAAHAQKHVASDTLRPEVSSLAIDSAAKLYKQGANSVVRSESETDAFQAAARKQISSMMKVAELARLKTHTCHDFEARQFNFSDDMCGVKLFRIADVLDSYNLEQSIWALQEGSSLWRSAVMSTEPGEEERMDEVRLAFYKSGVEAMTDMTPLLQAYGFLETGQLRASKALDFGCGLGAGSNALANLGFNETLCVDEAQNLLNEAQKSLVALQGQGEVVANISGKVTFVQSAPDLLCTVAPNSIDFVHSVGILQRMKPMLQVAYIEQFCDALRVGGSGYFQVPVKIDSASPSKKETVASRAKSAMRCELGEQNGRTKLHYSPKSEVVRHLQSRGCRVLQAIEKNKIGESGSNMQFVFDKP